MKQARMSSLRNDKATTESVNGITQCGHKCSLREALIVTRRESRRKDGVTDVQENDSWKKMTHGYMSAG